MIEEDFNYVPPHIEEYMQLVLDVQVWCEKRASNGDVSVETLARKFAENVVKGLGQIKH